jgi:flagellar biosynthesis/type III secretory pathway protein FliH
VTKDQEEFLPRMHEIETYIDRARAAGYNQGNREGYEQGLKHGLVVGFVATAATAICIALAIV